ncbi:MAG: inorganic phosphate transporter, PiT family [Acidimicrobiaceae bacterium]|jgi:PiT family inorganic phosphate transporter|nr:inorganic phosphate transporter, PiT family [Acidimicrobiaceae bacterium]MDQ1366956.1 inorganic phosphate transporter, PiT family [Acidimicrobiaceae bacterium]MDQ1369508.1 inorganic phosphate transporter, PiT family [Acidimicrobiaceae bacterium]MDQ1398734.1 inorganic phosphate transporter, PiT family [Acidimicrobiaceae bacterium]MDQ1411901.1 inorganic phosphate transporter, PiT family [Acidimicrobiaceae bacterium]
MRMVGLIFLIAVALGFDFTNGFHDAANAVAVSISTRALRPLTALGMAAGLNVVGALVSTKVAATVGKGIITTPAGTHGLVIVFSALVGGIAWNVLTWRLGLPSSSTHALIGGLVGAALGAASTVKWDGILTKVVLPMAASPVIGFVVGYLLMVAILWTFRRARPTVVNRRFRGAQSVSTAAMAFSHGTQDAQKTMGVITLALVATGHLRTFRVPYWVIFAAAAAMGLGTLAGGWKIIRTLGNRITTLDPPRGFAAQTSASAVLLISAYVYAMPVSSTHVMTSSIMGVGATRRLSAVRWGVAQQVVLAWVLTIPGAAATAWVVYHIANAVVRG